MSDIKDKMDYHFIVDNLTDGFAYMKMIFNEDGKPADIYFNDINAAYEKQTGLKRDQVVGHLLTESIPNVESVFLEKYGNLVKTGEPLKFEQYNNHTQRWYGVNAYSIHKDNEFFSFFTDITSRKEMDSKNSTDRTGYIQEIKDIGEAMQKNEEKYRMLFNSIDQGFFLIDVIFDENEKPADMYYVEANAAATRILGSDYTGRRLKDIDPTYEEYWFEIFGKVALTGESVRMEQYAEPDKKWYSFYIFRIGEKSRRIGNIFLDITERKLREDALKSSEQLYRTLLENTEDGYVLVQPIFDEFGDSDDYLMLEVNKAWEKQTGLRAADLVGKTIKESLPDVEPVWPATFANVVRSGKSVHFESYNRDSSRWYDIYAFNYQEDKAGVLFRDITERKKAEEALLGKTKQLEEANRQKEDILESISDCFYVLDKDLRFTYVNKPAEEIWGLPRSELIGCKIEDIFPNIIDISLSKFHQVLLEKSQQHYEVYSNVIGRWGDMGVYPMRDGISVYFRDITERKKAEEALAFQAHALASLQEAICAVDENFNITFWNEMAEEIFGWTAQEAVGSPSKEIFKMISPSDREETIDNILKNNGYTGEAIYRKKNGKEVHTSVICSIMWDAQRNYKGNVSSFRDITERKRMEEALRESEEKYRLLFNMMGEGFALYEVIYNDVGKPYDFRFIDVNPEYERWLAQPKTQIIGKSMREINPNIEQEWLDFFIKIAETGKPGVLTNYSGFSSKWIEVHAFSIKNGQIAFILRDITERKRAEEALQESEERQAFLLKLSDAIKPLSGAEMIQDAATRILAEHLKVSQVNYTDYHVDSGKANIQIESRTGTETSIAGTYNIDDYSSFINILKSGSDLVIPDILHYSDIPEDQRIRLASLGFQAQISVPLIKEGKLVATLTVRQVEPHEWTPQEVTLVHETAERTWAAVERAKVEEALSKREEQLRLAINASRIVVWDADLLTWKATGFEVMEELFGVSPSKDMTEGLNIYHPDDRERVLEEFTRAMEKGGEYQTEWRMPTKHGELRMLTIGRIVKDCTGKAVRAFGVIQDITERKRAEEALRESEERQEFLLKLSDALRPLADAAEIEETACCLLGLHLGVNRAYYPEINEAEGYAKVEGQFLRGTTSSMQGIYPLSAYSWSLPFLRRDEPVIVEDIHHPDKFPQEDVAAMEMIQQLSLVSVPLVKNGVLVGALTVSQDAPRVWKPEEVELVRETLERTWAAVERARMEEALHKSEEKFRVAMEILPDGFTILRPVRDANGQIVDFTFIYQNDAIASLGGTDPNAIVGHRLLELFPGHQGTVFLESYLHVAQTGEPRIFEAEYGLETMAKPTWFRIVVVRMNGDIAILAQDITESKKTEEALRESEKALRVSNENLAAEMDALRILHQINTSFLQQEDIHSIYKDVLNAAIKITNADCGDMQIADENDRLLMIAHKGFGEAFVNYYQIVEGVHTTCGIAVREKRRVITEDIANCPVLAGTPGLKIHQDEGIVCIQATPMFSSAGNLLGMLSTHYKDRHEFSDRELRLLDLLARQAADVIQCKKSEEELRESEKKANELVNGLEEADKNKNEFISVLSHELRNPLAAISAGIQILNITQDIKQASNVKEIINRQTNQLCKLVDDLLELTRVTQNKIKLKKEDINLNEIVKSAVEDIRLEYEKKGIKLGTKIQTKPIRLNADPVRVTQSMSNILFNALKFTRANGAVWLTLKQEKDHAVISIKDNGIGMSPELLSHLFKPFTQADKSLDRNGSGLGLGLSIVKGIVDLHGGSVSAYSDGLDKGSTFTIRLPITGGGIMMMENKASDSDDGKILRLLVIEDNKDFADLFSTMLSTIGYAVDIAYDGTEGLRLAKQIKPDVIFCDIGLPGMNGYDVAERIRNDIELKDIHLIALSGYASAGDAEVSLKAGFKRHLPKPIDFATLKNVLNEVTDNNKEVI